MVLTWNLLCKYVVKSRAIHSLSRWNETNLYKKCCLRQPTNVLFDQNADEREVFGPASDPSQKLRTLLVWFVSVSVKCDGEMQLKMKIMWIVDRYAIHNETLENTSRKKTLAKTFKQTS